MKKIKEFLLSDKFLRPGLTWKNLLKGFFVAILMSILTSLYSIFSTNITIDLKTIILLSLGAGISYLIKNLFTNSNQELFKNEKTDENM
jgi:hypothetical protein